MTTKDYIRKINDLAQEAASFNERHQVEAGLFGPSWLRNMPLNQFIELCDIFEHDPVQVKKWPHVWLNVAGIKILIWGAEKVPEQPAPPPPPPQPSALDYLRTIATEQAPTEP